MNVCSATLLSKNPVGTIGDSLVNAKSLKKVFVLSLFYIKYNINSGGLIV